MSILLKLSVADMAFHLPGHIAQQVERWTHEHIASGHDRLWVRIPGLPTKLTNGLSDEMLNRGFV